MLSLMKSGKLGKNMGGQNVGGECSEHGWKLSKAHWFRFLSVPASLERSILLSSGHREGSSHMRGYDPLQGRVRVLPVPAISEIPSV